MNFAALPPEINSGRMYAGAGSGPLLAAASAWDELAAELHSAAASYQSVVAGLTGGPWAGPSSVSMTAAVAPHVAWISATAAQCEEAGAQAQAAASAYEAAFAATVPPPAVAANRAQLMSLVATNFLGQNTPAIAATEAQYAAMWAQDAAAMHGYAGSAAIATQLTPFTPPKQNTDPSGQAGQAATAAQVASTSAQNTLSQPISAVPQALQGLASPLQAAPAQAMPPLGLPTTLLPSSAVGLLGLATPYTASIGTVNLATRLASQARNEAVAETVERIAVATGANDLEPADAGAPGSAVTMAGSTAPNAVGGPSAVTAGIGHSDSVGALSVPPAWTETAPPPIIRTVAHVEPDASLSAAPTIAAGGNGGTPEVLFSEMALASMVGRTMTVAGRRGSKTTYTITVTQNPQEPEEVG
jgi:PPE-repeat protein